MSTLTPFVDMNPVPRVLVDVPVVEFPAGSVAVSLTRTAEGRTFKVRGGQMLPAGSPAIVLDPEVPFGVESSYTVLGHDAAGNVIGSFPVGTVTLEFDGCVIQQPLDARLSVLVTPLLGFAPSTARATPGDVSYPQGRALPGLVGLGPRRGVQGLPIEVMVSSFADADMLQATLGGYEDRQLPVWLVRTPPDVRIPRVLFCHVPELVETDVTRSTAGVTVLYSATVTEVKPPAEGISGAVLTHSDMKVFFATHTQVKAAYVTHSDVKRDTSLIGAADA